MTGRVLRNPTEMEYEMLSRICAINPARLLAIGLLILSAASAWRALTTHLGPVADGVNGFLYGLGIGILLVACWRKRQRGTAPRQAQ